MKRNSYYLIIFLILSSILLTGVSIAGRKSVYARYNYNFKKDGPVLTLALRGFSDNISPLAVLGPPFDKDVKKQTASTSPADGGLKYFTAPSSDAAGSSSQTGSSATDLSASQTENPDSATGTASSPSEVPQGEETPPDPAAAVTSEQPPAENPAGGEVPAEQTPTDGTLPVTDPSSASVVPAPSQPETVPSGQISVTPAVGTPVDDSYYADALFIGDSRTVGLSQYVPGLDAYATFYCKTSLNIFNALSSPMVQMEDGLQTAEVALSRKQFGKIYIMLGINEIGYGTDSFISTYAEVIARIRALQPTAVIYVQGIMHVSASKQAENPVFNNAAVNERNGRLAALTNGADIVYMDINYLLDDASGALNSAYTFDGVHLTADSYALWYQEIKEQTR